MSRPSIFDRHPALADMAAAIVAAAVLIALMDLVTIGLAWVLHR